MSASTTAAAGASSTDTLTLYSWPESGNSYKVRLLLALLGVPHTVKNLDFLSQEQQSDWFRSINPKAEVPTLVHNQTTLTDSSSILAYIAATYDDSGRRGTGPSSYYGQDLLEQVKIIEWLAFANGWVQHGVFTARAILSYGGPYNGLGQNTSDDALLQVRLADAKVRAHKSLAIIDGELAKGDGWLVGYRPTIADISNFVYIALAPMGDVSLQAYPSVLAWIAAIKKLPGFISIPGLDDPLVRRRGTRFEAVTE
ncbi:thioredoxin-like protein [Ceraceosorus guamensis]|uniref:Thioredoxin-like protein n=1 Tax=Ceraceosorus guamensis TaxID=1522189 RepID=A0A316VPI6_9BASI|nr:thioredoxin-like protein [Ceraceosorus guamensis]PWN39487.1 thioredoxin-like protein [Ceraceosorus guamensis]